MFGNCVGLKVVLGAQSFIVAIIFFDISFPFSVRSLSLAFLPFLDICWTGKLYWKSARGIILANMKYVCTQMMLYKIAECYIWPNWTSHVFRAPLVLPTRQVLRVLLWSCQQFLKCYFLACGGLNQIETTVHVVKGAKPSFMGYF